LAASYRPLTRVAHHAAAQLDRTRTRLAVALRGPARRLTGPERCLLLVGAQPDLVAELNRADVPAVLADTSGIPAA
jgi:hypothetical protein